ncbi:hypothetical protein NMG60_11028963 [Bertholletia excelsa]
MSLLYSTSLSRSVQARNDIHDPYSLSDLILDYANKEVVSPELGILYDLSLPPNLAGMEAAMVRIEVSDFWFGGANLSFFQIPPRTLPLPYMSELDTVYQNLSNLSSFYYNVPNHTLPNSTTKSLMLEFYASGCPNLVDFPRIFSSPKDENFPMKCVRFGKNGSVEMSNLAGLSSCGFMKNGYVAICDAFTLEEREVLEMMAGGIWGVGGGLVVLGGVIEFVGCEVFKKKRTEQMERQSESYRTLKTMWIWGCKMPSFTLVRTKPVLENSNFL